MSYRDIDNKSPIFGMIVGLIFIIFIIILYILTN